METAVSTQVAIISMQDIDLMAKRMARLFGKTPEDLAALMLIAQAEGRHPAVAAQEYDVIQGRPAIKSQVALARFQQSGGKVVWIKRTDDCAEAQFSHTQGGEVIVRWDMAKAQRMGLSGKDNWKKQPGVMLQWRVVAEGVRIVYPACLSQMYLVEEVQDFEPRPEQKPVRNVTPQAEPRGEPEASKPSAKAGKPEQKPASTAHDADVQQLSEILERAVDNQLISETEAWETIKVLDSKVGADRQKYVARVAQHLEKLATKKVAEDVPHEEMVTKTEQEEETYSELFT